MEDAVVHHARKAAFWKGFIIAAIIGLIAGYAWGHRQGIADECAHLTEQFQGTVYCKR